MSVRTIFLNCFCQFIIFLYLLDNETSWVILISVGISLMIEIWKIKKAVIIKVDYLIKYTLEKLIFCFRLIGVRNFQLLLKIEKVILLVEQKNMMHLQ